MPPQDDKDRHNQVLGLQVVGLIFLSVGMGLLRVWIGLVAFGLGLLLMGIAQELD